MGVMTINEIRRELDLPHLEDGDTSFVQVNVQTLKNAATASTTTDSTTTKEESTTDSTKEDEESTEDSNTDDSDDITETDKKDLNTKTNEKTL